MLPLLRLFRHSRVAFDIPFQKLRSVPTNSLVFSTLESIGQVPHVLHNITQHDRDTTRYSCSVGKRASFRAAGVCVWGRGRLPPPLSLEVAAPEKETICIRRCHPYARKPASQAVVGIIDRMQLTLHATRPTPHGASRLVQAMSAWSVKTRRAPVPAL